MVLEERAAAGAVAVVGALVFVSAWMLSGVEADYVGERLRVVGTGIIGPVRLAGRRAGRALRAFSLRPGGDRPGLDEMAEMIDVVRLGLSAGLSFDAALGLYCEGASGVLSGELACALMSWQVGVSSRQEALMGVARALDSTELESFSVAVSQALELGAPLADTLERQGAEMRAAHKARVEREIERAPVKLLVPTGVLILPALLISIIGPLMAAGGMI